MFSLCDNQHLDLHPGVGTFPSPARVRCCLLTQKQQLWKVKWEGVGMTFFLLLLPC